MRMCRRITASIGKDRGPSSEGRERGLKKNEKS